MATKAKTTHKCARAATRKVVVAPVACVSDPATRKLSPRDSKLLIEYLAKPSKPNAALRAAARKYWHLI